MPKAFEVDQKMFHDIIKTIPPEHLAEAFATTITLIAIGPGSLSDNVSSEMFKKHPQIVMVLFNYLTCARERAAYEEGKAETGSINDLMKGE